MNITTNKLAYQTLSSIWPGLNHWLTTLEQNNQLSEADMQPGLHAAIQWHNDNPFGSIDNRSSRTLGVFLKTLDTDLLKKYHHGCITLLPIGVQQALAPFIWEKDFTHEEVSYGREQQ